MDCLTRGCDENSRDDDEALLGMLPTVCLTEGREENSSKDDEALLCMSPAVVLSWDDGFSSCVFDSCDTEHSGFSSNVGNSSSIASSVAELAACSSPAGKLSVSSEESDEATESGKRFHIIFMTVVLYL